MNLIPFAGKLAKGANSVAVNGATIPVPEIRDEASSDRLVLGARPEHICFDDGSKLRGEVFGAEYLGTTQIVTVTTAHGQVRARLPSTAKVATGEQVGLTFLGERLSLFDETSGRALKTALHDGAGHG